MGKEIFLGDVVSAASRWGLDLPLMQSFMKLVIEGHQIFWDM